MTNLTLLLNRVRSACSPAFFFATIVLTPFLLVPPSASAQSVEAVADKMQARYEEQLRTVDTFIIETNDYTSYHEKVVRNGSPTFRSATQWRGGDLMYEDEGTASTVYGFDFDQLKEHARYEGTEAIDGARAHVLIIDDPAAFDPEMEMPTEGEATRLTYYISAERHLPVRMVMESEASSSEPASNVVVDLKDYRTTEGLTLPRRMEMRFDIGLSAEQRREMEKMLKQFDNMPEEQREQMEKMMGDGMNTMRGALSGEPVVVEIQSVRVNEDLPDGIF